MLKKTKLCTGLMVACGGVLLSAGQSSFAQNTGNTQTLERVEVTGSNIRRTDVETPSPVQVITQAEMVKSGFTSVAEILQNITANGQGTLNTGFNQAFAAGAAGVSLRGLTTGATLVLIDGRRMAPYPLSDDGQRPFVDIASLPFSAVERIEILKDGASAIYGSDAIAGVVNVILRKSVTGTHLTGEIGTTQHGGGTTAKASIIQGFSGDNPEKLNGYVGLEYRTQEEISLSSRSGDWTTLDWRSQGGRDLRPGARNDLVNAPRLASPYLQIPGGSSNDPASFAFYPGCTFTDMRANNCTYDYGAQIQPETENTNLIGRLNFGLGNGWKSSVTASYFDSKGQQTRYGATVPFGSFGGYTFIGPNQPPTIVGALPTFTVPANYPGNTLGVPANVRGNVFGMSPRVEDIHSGSTRIVAELNGNVGAWDVNGAIGYTNVRTSQTFHNYANADFLFDALNDPVNPFLLQGGNTLANNERVAPTVSSTSTDTLSFASVRGSRDLMPLDGGALGLAIGVDFRKKDLNAPGTGYYWMNNTYAVGTEKVSSAYAELSAPVLKTLELDAALRYDHYNTYGGQTTPKFGFKYTPVKEVAVRGTFAKGFRAPSPAENGNAGAIFQFNAIRDPVLCPVSNPDGSPNTTSPANVPAYCSFSPAYLQNSSKDLKAETSKSYTLGLIFEPVRNWSNTVDFYKIEIDNQIIPAASLSTYDPLAHAVRSAPQVVTFGDGTTGLSSVGPIQYATVPYVNGQTTSTSGIELETRYRLATQTYGGFTVAVAYAHMFSYTVTVNGTTSQLAGTHGPSIVGGDTGNPKDKAALTLGWDYGPWSVNTVAYYTGSYSVTDPQQGWNDCAAGINNVTLDFINDPPSQYCKVGSFTTWNLVGQYKLNKSLTIRGTVQNLFDRKPPVDVATYGATGSNASSLGANGIAYNPSLHQAGAIGRFFSVGVDYEF